MEICAMNGRAVPGQERFGNGLLLDVLALCGGAKHIHVVAAQHGRRIRILAAGVGIDLRIQHQGFYVRAILQNHFGGVLIPDVAHASVAAHHPDFRKFQNFLVGHQMHR